MQTTRDFCNCKKINEFLWFQILYRIFFKKEVFTIPRYDLQTILFRTIFTYTLHIWVGVIWNCHKSIKLNCCVFWMKPTIIIYQKYKSNVLKDTKQTDHIKEYFVCENSINEFSK